jgi:hypothetical protein
MREDYNIGITQRKGIKQFILNPGKAAGLTSGNESDDIVD